MARTAYTAAVLAVFLGLALAAQRLLAPDLAGLLGALIMAVGTLAWSFGLTYVDPEFPDVAGAREYLHRQLLYPLSLLPWIQGFWIGVVSDRPLAVGAACAAIDLLGPFLTLRALPTSSGEPDTTPAPLVREWLWIALKLGIGVVVGAVTAAVV